ncbi:MAG TPA: hypothetical protein VFA71_07220 [Terriglobales bacterium]|nr:hypothetical protein [Terriglobales bacterium]
MLVLLSSSLLVAQAAQPVTVAGLHSSKNVVWQRTSPNAKQPDGPVLYQIIFRSSATPTHVPVISPTFTLIDSPISVVGGNVVIGGMSINGSTGVISFAGADNDLTLQAGTASSGTDQLGGELVLSAGNGTGLGASGNVHFQTAGAQDLSGTATDLLVDRVIIVSKAKAMTLASPGFTSLMSIQLLGTHTAGGRIHYVIRATDGGSQIATESGVIQYLATANSITCTVQTTDKLHLGTVNSGCTPGFFNPGSQPGVSIFDNVSFSSPAPIVVHEVYFTIENESGSPVRLEP